MKKIKIPISELIKISDRKFKKRIRRIKVIERRNAKKIINDYVSEPINLCCENNKINKKKDKKYFNIKLPKIFSIIDNPKESLEQIFLFCNTRRLKAKNVYKFDYRNVEKIDLSAEALLGYFCLEARKEKKFSKIKSEGFYPINNDAKRLIKSVGVINNLGIKHEYLDNGEKKRINICKYNSTTAKSVSVKMRKSDYKENVLLKFISHIDKCLDSVNRTLTMQGKDELSKYTGEILTNAEEHSGKNLWHIVGYLDNISNERLCEIVIINFGKTIAETLSDIPKDSHIFSVINPYVQLHNSKGFFGEKWKKEDLLTLVALQGGVSRRNMVESDHSGRGTIDIITFFQKVYKECSENSDKGKMSIVSGSSYVLFDGKYQMKENKIAFNGNNDLSCQPDIDYVKNLGDVFFPGTIIGIKFQLPTNFAGEIDE